ncbi:hypothetical protein BJ508DRAFT_313928 [Ascobolus immersus RN42]|uniref:DUF7580 domain-containing protein n=1 Tax=Ascobolus immersus RN42 TaxID=1160509 RepID=A0A3N4HGV3_ASCIM|nr:hypothetical protein BJ508DRAFT_313928 [Ascobolus immersus RN42]
MPVAETAGLALAAIGMIPPALAAYKCCRELFKGNRKYDKDFAAYSSTIVTEERLFSNQCKLILAILADVQPKEASKMLDNLDHPSWEDPTLATNYQLCDGTFEIPFKVIQDSLEDVVRILKSLPWGKEDNCEVANTATKEVDNSTILQSGTNRFDIPSFHLGSRIKWNAKVKDEVDSLMKRIKEEGERLARLTKQYKQLLPRKARPCSSIIFPTVNPQLADYRELKRIAQLCDTSKALYSGVETTVSCSCHSVLLQLPQDELDRPGNTKSASTLQSNFGVTTSNSLAKFRMLVSLQPERLGGSAPSVMSDAYCTCTSILVTSEFHATGVEASKQDFLAVRQIEKRKASISSSSVDTTKRVRIIPKNAHSVHFPEQPLETDLLQPQTNLQQANTRETPASTVQTGVCFESESKGKKRPLPSELPPRKRLRSLLKVGSSKDETFTPVQDGKEVHIAGKQPKGSILKASAPSLLSIPIQSQPIVLSRIDNLCLLMSKLNAGEGKDECLGHITLPTAPNMPSYRHLIYHEVSPKIIQTNRTSLAKIMANGSRRLNLEESYHMAHLLSWSLLCLGSSPSTWFMDGWGSKDFQFFLGNKDRQESEHLYTLKPYITPRFTATKFPPMPAKNPFAEDPQLFSLSVVLIELAFGQEIREIDIPSPTEQQDESFSNDPSGDYLKVKAIVDRGLLSRFGSRFADIVKMCFYCKFGVASNSLSDEKMRERFYFVVVKALKERLDCFRGVF